MLRFVAFVAMAASLLACSTPAQTKTSSSPRPAASVATLATVPLTGNVLAAAGIIAQGAGNIVAQGAGNWHLLEITESPLAGAEVFLANPDGTQVKGTKTALTDAKGNYKLPDVPVGATVVVATHVKTKDGKDALMETLAVPSKDATSAGMGTATTLVARAVLGSARAKPGLVDVTNWVETVEICKGQLKPGEWPDLANQQAIDDWMTGLQTSLPDMDAHVKKLKANLAGS
jgi:hypothetical protein